MRNPNDVTTDIRQTTTDLEITFGYANAHLAQYDLNSVKECYGSDASVEVVNNKIVVTMPIR